MRWILSHRLRQLYHSSTTTNRFINQRVKTRDFRNLDAFNRSTFSFPTRFSSSSSPPDTSPTTFEQWKRQAEKEVSRHKHQNPHSPIQSLEDLQNGRLLPEGISLQPVYHNNHHHNNTNTNDDDEMPGVPPYTRGPYATMYTLRPWTIRQYGGFGTVSETNQFFRDNLKRGQQGLSVAFDLPTHRGYDSDFGQEGEEEGAGSRVGGDVGMAGVAIDSVEDMKLLFDGIDLTKASVSMTMNGAVLPIMAMYIQTALEQQQEQDEKDVLKLLRGTIQNDILKEYTVRNTYIYPPKPSLERVTCDIMGYVVGCMPKFHPLSVSGYHYQEAGADCGLELGLTLACALEYVKLGVDVGGLDVNDLCGKLSFFWGIGMKYYLEIAKLRAARRLWSNLLLQTYPDTILNPQSLLLKAHTQTSGYTLTSLQPHNNTIRTTIQALAAIHGGTQSLHTNSHDEALGLPTLESSRLARNCQLILREETSVGDVVDPWAGSFMMETLTDQVEEKALEVLKEVEDAGGMTEYVQRGMGKIRIEECATRKQGRIDSGQDVIVGVNKYHIQQDQGNVTTEDVRRIDNHAVRNEQIQRLNQLRNNRDSKAVSDCLEKLEISARLDRNTSRWDDPNNLLRLSVEAAKARCTLGEISLALEKAWGRHIPTSSVVQGAYGASFASDNDNNNDDNQYESIFEQVHQFEIEEGRRPRILVAKMGQDGHDRGAKVIASGFSDLGFDVDIGPLFQTPREVAIQALDSDVHVIGISSQAAGHRTLLPALRDELTKLQTNIDDEQAMTNIVVVAGGVIPPQDHHYLLNEEKCCDAIFGPGTRVTDAAKDVLFWIREKRKKRKESP